MGVLETALGIVVVGLAVWLLVGSSPQSRTPRFDQSARFTGRDDVELRRNNG